MKYCVALVATVLALLSAHSAWAATYYVAPNGSDTAAGTQSAPFLSWARAQTAAAPGDTVYFRGGTYKYTDSTSTCSGTGATVDAVVLSKSGTSGNPIKYWAYPGETPVFDFSGVTDKSKYNCRHSGVRVEADWLYLKGLEFTGVLQLNNLNHESWCVYITNGNNNVFELLNAHHNMGPGFFLTHGGNNTFLNCDSHENEDTLTSNGDGQSADGFGCHPNQVGDTGNIFHGCRGWWNSDDNWDFINASEACTVEYSWAWYAGYKPDTLNNGQPVSLPAGNGNGFKGGGYGLPQTNVPAKPPQHVIRHNCSFFNKDAGVYANHEIVSPFFYNNTSFNNGTDFNLLGLNGTTVTSVGILRNNIAYSNDGRALLSNNTNAGPISDQNNSWDTSLNLKVTDADFRSVAFTPAVSCPPTDMTCFAGMASARQADGSLPVVPFLRLAANSPLIGKGVDVGLPFSGKAPDLGCFDSVLPFGGGDGGVAVGIGSDGGGSTSSGSGGATSSGSAGSSGALDADASLDDGSTSASSGSAAASTTSSSTSSATGSTGSTGSTASTGSGGSTGTVGRGSGSEGDAGAGAAGSPAGCGCHVAVDLDARRDGFALLALGALGFVARRRARRGRKRSATGRGASSPEARPNGQD